MWPAHKSATRVANLIGASALLVGCGSADPSGNSSSNGQGQDATHRAKMAGASSNSERAVMEEWKDNPADRPGAIVIRPERDPLLVYDPKTEVTVDTRNGDRFAFKSGHAGGLALFNLERADGELIVLGNIKSRGLSTSRKMSMYEIVRARTGHGKAPDLLPSEYDLTRVANLLRAHLKGMQPGLPIEVMIVDNRDHYSRSKTH